MITFKDDFAINLKRERKVKNYKRNGYEIKNPL